MVVRQTVRFANVIVAIWRPLLALLVLDCAVTLAYVWLGWTWIAPASVPLPLIGTGLAVFLGLRNNTAYARWWEARTLWGSVVNESRNFARSLAVILPDALDEGRRRALVEHQIAWAHALRAGLRREDAAADVHRRLPDEAAHDIEEVGNVAFTVQRRMGDLLAEAARAGRLDSIQLVALNGILSRLADAQGGLERIANTPMPRQYASFPRLFVGIYCLMLPFGVVADLQLLTPIGSTLIGFVFLALDAAGRNLENPFARSVHDVPMSAITRTIEIDLKQAIGEPDRPKPLKPVPGILRLGA